MPSSRRHSPLKTVFIPSGNIETIPEEYLDEQGIPQSRLLVRGSVNGNPFSVECDRPVQVSAEVAEALQGLIHKQAQGA